jgi:DNA repair exonuclease SbcCD ATPase subunit
MKNNSWNYVPVILCILAIGAASIAWTGDKQNKFYQSLQDTIPAKKKSSSADKIHKKDFDKEIDELDKAMKEVHQIPDIDFEKMQADINTSMKKLDEEMAKHKIDMQQMQKELNESLSKINLDKMQSDLRNSVKELDKLDVDKMQKDLKESLSNLDNEKMKADIQLSLKQLDKLDLDKMKDDIKAAIENIKVNVNAEDLRKDVLESLDKIDMDKVKKEMKNAQEEMQKHKGDMKLDMDKMRKDLDKAKSELKGYQEMVYDMEKDGLLKTSSDYTIEFKNGDLIVNGSKLSSQQVSKYKKYFSKDGVTIRKEKGEMNINIQ